MTPLVKELDNKLDNLGQTPRTNTVERDAILTSSPLISNFVTLHSCPPNIYTFLMCELDGILSVIIFYICLMFSDHNPC